MPHEPRRGPRSPAERKADALARLETDQDCWVATASPSGVPSMVPLSFWWDGTALHVATAERNPTSTNIRATGSAVVVVGHSRDVVHITARASRIVDDEATDAVARAFAAKCDWDPREDGYPFFRLSPERIESWRELDEHADRRLMDDGRWIV